ncbi:MAG TPA: hypothetical protein VFZ59_03565 [Verrucomicrobiae bacterium]|nr:hypothetical protein [Verrucomicrobiae bacterium]
MRPGLNREIVRERTAYRVGRVAVDVLVLLQWIGTTLFLVLYFRLVPQMEGPQGLASLSMAVGFAVVSSVGVIVFRELAHAVFDIADRALDGTKPGQGSGENPFQ